MKLPELPPMVYETSGPWGIVRVLEDGSIELLLREPVITLPVDVSAEVAAVVVRQRLLPHAGGR